VIEALRVTILGFCLYVSPQLFLTVGPMWFEELQESEAWESRAQTLHRKFWRAFGLVVGLVFVVTTVLFWRGCIHALSLHQVLRLFAVILALTATLGRGGWDIQSYKGRTVIERIDRGMYVLSQLGATTLLLILLLSEAR
jgi:hypothetical protein